MDKKVFDMGPIDIAWCPGCGDYGILNAVKQTMAELEIPPEKLVIVSGIGQAAKLPHYMRSNFFNGLHGRAIPPATAIKITNPDLVVIAESGDGDIYGEGGNHFLHAMRRNPDITVIVHDNMVYGLTKGQASPTSREGFKTPVQVDGVILKPFNPIAVGIANGASFVARASITDIPGTVKILKAAIQHKGFSLVDLFQPCVTFNKLNTYQWFKDNTYYLEDSYDPHDKVEAFKRALEEDKLPLGIFYVEERKTFEENNMAYAEDKTPLYKRNVDLKKLSSLIDSMRKD
ncbi:MAG: 2-oxoacid ferredoxin oxidoreductase [Mesoaciditoga sp.]|uniref:thiamine pyrophosphate-dependent enzyme n=1 Tax=Athalassotoga sp. TaxID=2022597 RepID=UPI000CB35346|nr:MAG: 2-oxoacid ferredoxin oxidoreductase [Mesoaciditoga sp.]PMP80333.1 MAG: 2-oxoacid ferredoxin oxidoreductase [Mesoaciditoga sp.]HEU25054.1 2-oxoacid ferredoxin oxidoreductase [Mesoaciditoga lauensis]